MTQYLLPVDKTKNELQIAQRGLLKIASEGA